jgi:hypothetical protein
MTYPRAKWRLTLFLEEAGFPYTIHPVNLSRGDQFKPEFLAISPKADNYNHLMEQPTLFYAVTLTLALVDAGSGLNTGFDARGANAHENLIRVRSWVR